VGTAVLFPGQGSQQVGMGADGFERSPAARAVFEQADELLGFSLSELCFFGPENQLTDTVNQQPALFTTSIAYWHALQEKGFSASDFMAGHSLGEFSALVAAGSITFEDGLALVQKRGELMKIAGELAPGGMAAILALDVTTVQKLCQKARSESGFPVQLANDNCPGQIVISGHEKALQLAMKLAGEAGARKIVRLPISIAAHSILMEKVTEEFAQAVNATPVQVPYTPVIGNVSAFPLRTTDEIRHELKSQLTSSVAWTDSIRYLLAHGVDTFIEVGPGNVLLGLVKRVDRQAKRVEFEV
jgi:[acyl-carrier-protein] S-malonyltransferase